MPEGHGSAVIGKQKRHILRSERFDVFILSVSWEFLFNVIERFGHQFFIVIRPQETECAVYEEVFDKQLLKFITISVIISFFLKRSDDSVEDRKDVIHFRRIPRSEDRCSALQIVNADVVVITDPAGMREDIQSYGNIFIP